MCGSINFHFLLCQPTSSSVLFSSPLCVLSTSGSGILGSFNSSDCVSGVHGCTFGFAYVSRASETGTVSGSHGACSSMGKDPLPFQPQDSWALDEVLEDTLDLLGSWMGLCLQVSQFIYSILTLGLTFSLSSTIEPWASLSTGYSPYWSSFEHTPYKEWTCAHQ